ncbi:MAG: serine hydrolase [Phycisphaerales bacterium]
MRTVPIALLLAFVTAAAPAQDASPRESEALFAEVLASTPRLRGLAAEPERYRLQICFAEIVENGDDPPRLRRYAYRPDAEYWYPASTVKLPGAVAALDALESFEGVTPDTPLRFAPLFAGEDGHEHDESNAQGGTITARHLVRKALIVSDNGAFNRLYDIAGQRGLNNTLRAYGLANPRIVHRLASARAPDAHRRAPAVTLGDTGLVIPARLDPPGIDPGLMTRWESWPTIPLGRAWQRSGEVVHEPFLMGGRNFIPLRDLLNLTAMVVRPDVDTGLPGIDLEPDSRALLIRAMTQLPRESANPVYDPSRFDDYWAHFFLPGLERAAPRHELRVASKIGLAYGFSSEVAYIEHTPSGRAFLLAMALYTNDNATLNDGVYEYELAHAAMADVAEALARRVLDLPEGEVLAPAPFTHEHVPLRGEAAVNLAAGEIFESETFGARAVSEAVASWNADVGPGAGVAFEVRVKRTPDGVWQPWLRLGHAGATPPEGVTRGKTASVAIDTLTAIDGPWSDMQFRAMAHGGPVTLHRFDAVLTSDAPAARRVRDERSAGRVEHAVPFLPNDCDDADLASRLCSPLSTRMLLAHRGVEVGPIEPLAARVHNDVHDLYGVWPDAIQAAFEAGAPGRLARFADWHAVRRHLDTVGPLAISIRFEPGELRGVAYDGAGGHLVVLYGLDEQGDALVLDPAFGDEPEARRTYRREDLSRVWLNASKGLAYALLPRGEHP